MGSRFVALCAICAVVVAAASCGGGSDGSNHAGGPDGSPAQGRLASGATFTTALTADPGSLDFPANQGTALQALMPFAYDALVATDKGTKILPALATSWKIDVRKATFTLRKGVTCSDGSPVTPAVVAENFNYLRNPKVGFPIFGFVSDWDVTANDATNTVTFHFKTPVGFPLQSVADIGIVCGRGLKDRSVLKRGTSGSGPYVLAEAVPNDHYTLRLRKDYAWGPGGVTSKQPGLPAKVVLRVVTDPATRVNLLVTGQLDAAPINFANEPRLRSAGVGVAEPQGSIAQLAFNHAKGRPTADAAVRRALTMAVDRATVAKVAHGDVTNNLVAPLTNPCPDPANVKAIPAHDLAAAAAALDQAGWHKGAGGIRTKGGKRLALSVPIAASYSPEWQAAAELVTKAWHDLGVDVHERTLADNALIQTINSGAWDAAPMYQINVPNPATLAAFLSGPAPPNGGNFSAIDNPAYAKAVGQALTTAAPAAACQRWNEGERALYSQADMIPLISGPILTGVGRKTTFDITTYGVVPFSIRMHAG